MTPTGNSQYYRARCGIVVYSHLTGCGGADLGRHCGGSPCLSHCSPSAHESPQDCPKPVILPLYTHAHVKVIQTNRASRTHTHKYTKQSLQTHNTKCKHWTWTDSSTNTLHILQTGKKTTNTKNNTKRRQTEDVTTGDTENTHKHSKLFNPKYLLHRPHMQQNQRNSGTWHQYKIRRKSLQKSQCGWWVRSNTPKKNAKICRGKRK